MLQLLEDGVELRRGPLPPVAGRESGQGLLDRALRTALEQTFPELATLELTDYKVRILEGSAGTGAITRVLIESSDGVDVWGTVGMSENIVQASYAALVDSIEYKLLRDEERAKRRK